MFGRKKDQSVTAKEVPVTTQGPASTRSQQSQASSMAHPSTDRPSGSGGFRPEIARRVPDLPGTSRSAGDDNDDAKKLIVGREIELNGEITACDTLVVEGKVTATLGHCRRIDIAEPGVFKGSADIEEAEISGLFEGDLKVRGHLLLRASGRIKGDVRYGRLEIESGGEIIGNMATIDAEADAPAATPLAAAEAS